MSKRILYVEDDVDTRILVKRILEKKGYYVITASSGEECLNRLKIETPDLLLLDMMLPDMRGWDVFNKIINYGRHYRAEHKIEDKSCEETI